MIVPIILAGGKGTRLWPLSRSQAPKQFLTFLGDESLFQQALRRVSDRQIYHPAVVITNEDYRFTVVDQARKAGCVLGGVLLEPVARNTAPAIAAAAHFAQATFGDDVLLHILASDHVMDGGLPLTEAVQRAAGTASAGYLITFGITPVEAATGYGYIRAGAPLEGGAVRAVDAFVEKPNADDAANMLAAGGYLWNSGMFLFQASTFLNALTATGSDISAHTAKAVARGEQDGDFLRLNPDAFSACPDISIDYAVMEKAENAAVVPFSGHWSDLGGWRAVWKSAPHDADGNAAIGDVTLDDCKNVLAFSRSDHVAVQGLSDAVVVASEDAVYVGTLSKADRVGTLAKALAANPATAKLAEEHPTVYRPWGGYTSVLAGDRFQVKKLFVLPGKKLSLQKHHHRAEHWVVVCGTAEVTVGSEVSVLKENQSTYIPLGEVHRLANPGNDMLEVIEVQTGSYLGEDDIVRLEDEFGRN